MKKVNFTDTWNILKVSGSRKIHSDDIKSINISDSGNSYEVVLNNENGILFFPKDKCNFYIE